MLRDLPIGLYAALQRDRGPTMAEYAVVPAVIAIGIFIALGNLRGDELRLKLHEVIARQKQRDIFLDAGNAFKDPAKAEVFRRRCRRPS